MYSDMTRNTTVEEIALKEVKLISCGYVKQGTITILCILADGTKLPLFLILNRKTIPNNKKFPVDFVVCASPKGKMNAELCYISRKLSRISGAA